MMIITNKNSAFNDKINVSKLSSKLYNSKL